MIISSIIKYLFKLVCFPFVFMINAYKAIALLKRPYKSGKYGIKYDAKETELEMKDYFSNISYAWRDMWSVFSNS